MSEEKNSTEDLKTLRNYALGVAGFGTTISAVLIQAFHFPTEPTILCVIGFALLLLLVVYLIGRAEGRLNLMLKDHIDEAQISLGEMDKRFDKVDDVLLEIQRSTTRTELSNEIQFHPENHDTILRIAERYFGKKENGGLEGNWVMEDVFQNWVDSEKKNGRPVNVPKEW